MLNSYYSAVCFNQSEMCSTLIDQLFGWVLLETWQLLYLLAPSPRNNWRNTWRRQHGVVWPSEMVQEWDFPGSNPRLNDLLPTCYPWFLDGRLVCNLSSEVKNRSLQACTTWNIYQPAMTNFCVCVCVCARVRVVIAGFSRRDLPEFKQKLKMKVT